MRFYKIDCEGKVLLERRSPSGLSNEQARFLYDTDNDYLIFNDGTGFRKIWDEGNDGPGSGLDADLLDGRQSGNASGEIPVSNGTKCTDLNCDLFDDETGSFYLDVTNHTGTIPSARLSGLYNISISGSARYA